MTEWFLCFHVSGPFPLDWLLCWRKYDVAQAGPKWPQGEGLSDGGMFSQVVSAHHHSCIIIKVFFYSFLLFYVLFENSVHLICYCYEIMFINISVHLASGGRNYLLIFSWSHIDIICDSLWQKRNKDVSVWSFWVMDSNRKCNQRALMWHKFQKCA